MSLESVSKTRHVIPYLWFIPYLSLTKLKNHEKTNNEENNIVFHFLVITITITRGGIGVGTWEPSSQKVFQFGKKKIQFRACLLNLSDLIYSNSVSRVSANHLKLSFYATQINFHAKICSSSRKKLQNITYNLILGIGIHISNMQHNVLWNEAIEKKIFQWRPFLLSLSGVFKYLTTQLMKAN